MPLEDNNRDYENLRRESISGLSDNRWLWQRQTMERIAEALARLD